MEVAVYELASIGVISADRVDLFPRVIRHFHDLTEHILAAQGEITPADIET